MAGVYSVAQVNSYIKNMFAQDFLLRRLSVKGEVSNCKYHSSGHTYFTLKDGGGTLQAVMFASQRRGLNFKLAEGQQVVVKGTVDVYERDGKYQLYAREIQKDGEGDLFLKYEALKKTLEEMGMLHIKKVGVQRILCSEDSPKILFQKAGDILQNPVKRTIYIPKELVKTELLESGYSALAEYSMLNAPNVKCYATERISQWKDVMTNSLQNSQVQVAVEMWRYNPRKLSTRNIVDELSLALALREDADERVEEAVEEMLNELWRKIDGYRN